MNLYVIIAILLYLYMIFDYEKAFILYCIFKIVLSLSVNLINVLGYPVLSLEMFSNIVFILYGLIYKMRLIEGIKRFPLNKEYYLLLLSMIVSVMFSTIGFVESFSRVVAFIINEYLFLCVFWTITSKRINTYRLISGYAFMMVILGLYGFYEKITGLNPIYEYTNSLNIGYKSLKWDGSERLDMIMVRSAISHPIGFGLYMASFLLFYWGLSVNNMLEKKTIIFNKYFVILLCLLGAWFSNTRSALLFMIIGLVGVIDLKKKQTYMVIAFVAVIMVYMSDFFVPYYENLISIFSKDGTTANVGGSSISLRIDQFLSLFEYYKGNELFGMGLKASEIDTDKYYRLLGLESVWLLLLFERGLFGVASFLYLITGLYLLIQRTGKTYILFIFIAWLFVITASSTPGFEAYYFISLIILSVRVFESQKIVEEEVCISKKI